MSQGFFLTWTRYEMHFLSEGIHAEISIKLKKQERLQKKVFQVLLDTEVWLHFTPSQVIDVNSDLEAPLTEIKMIPFHFHHPFRFFSFPSGSSIFLNLSIVVYNPAHCFLLFYLNMP